MSPFSSTQNFTEASKHDRLSKKEFSFILVITPRTLQWIESKKEEFSPYGMNERSTSDLVRRFARGCCVVILDDRTILVDVVGA